MEPPFAALGLALFENTHQVLRRQIAASAASLRAGDLG
jgi:hypothetical protein